MSYNDFLETKRQLDGMHGFEPLWMPEFLKDFQRHLVEWAIRKGRAGIFAECGLGKTPMQLVWAENIVRHTNKSVLILTPLAVSTQTVKEADKFGIEVERSQNGEYSHKIVVTNYERLHHFDPTKFVGVVCDESSILKSFSGATRKRITRFMSKLPYRLLCTATPSPNDYVELGTSSEALGELSNSEMLRRFFKYLDDKGQKKEQRLQNQAETVIASDPSYYKKLAFRVAQTIGQWRLKHHAITGFWRWVSSWARACRLPSDLGFNDDDFLLPELNEVDHVISPDTPPPGMLFNAPAFGMQAEREERRRTLQQRSDYVAELVEHDRPSVIWCHLNAEADNLEKTIPNARQIAGRTPDEEKIELYEAFLSGELSKLVLKPKLGAWGLNWQHCNHVVSYPSHSWEAYRQSIGRCHRFGQMKPVTVDVVATEGEVRVLANMRQKGAKADAMFASMLEQMHDAERIEHDNIYTQNEKVPSWL
jgi:superfamily II DNA or RNA helicase